MQRPREGILFSSEPAPAYFHPLGQNTPPAQPAMDESLLFEQEGFESKLQEGPTPIDLPEVVGQLGNTYILCQAKDGLLMIDQHAAHERVVYEGLKKGLQASSIEIQTLLIPYELEFSVKESRIAIEKTSVWCPVR